MEINKLTKTEEEIMQLLWEAGRATVSQLLEQLPEQGRPPHSTLSSVVRILEKKGYVGHKAYGKTHEYFPLIQREAYGRQSLRDILHNYFDGSVQRLVSHLVDETAPDDAITAALLKQLEEKDTESGHFST